MLCLITRMLCLTLAGCALERGNRSATAYVALSCDQLGQETVNLMRASADRSHHLLGDNQAKRDAARKQLLLVKQAYAEKQC